MDQRKTSQCDRNSQQQEYHIVNAIQYHLFAASNYLPVSFFANHGSAW
jgi:hypothetical protein